MAFIIEKRFSEGEGCPMPRCASQNFTEAIGGGRICAECKVWFTKPRQTPQPLPGRVLDSQPNSEYEFDAFKVRLLNAIISGEVGDPERRIEQQLGPIPLGSTYTVKEKEEDSEAGEEIALFRNLKLKEATTSPSQHQDNPCPNEDLPQFDHPVIGQIICGTPSQEPKAIQRGLSTASESRKEIWHQQTIDPVILYFRQVAAKTRKLAPLNPDTIVYIATQMEDGKALYPKAMMWNADEYTMQIVKTLRHHIALKSE
ncbi:hypothetical protein MMC30_007321 [Trapelia coarctata]|nr:hypothetical protein [Trapelia coarctata]